MHCHFIQDRVAVFIKEKQMTPQKRQKANVKKILDNPVQSKVQEVLRPKKEGFFGWLSYLGWSLLIIPFTFWFDDFLPNDIIPIYTIDKFDYYYLTQRLWGIGLILAVINMIKFRNYHSKVLFLISFCLSGLTTLFLFKLGTSRIDIPHRLLSIYSTNVRYYILYTLYFYSLCWYSYYFYKKSKTGYRWVWLKVLIPFLLPLLPLLFIELETDPLSRWV